jgi:hypothetical protein
MPASGLTGVSGASGGGGGVWTRATVGTDYTANTTEFHTVPASVLSLTCKKLYRCRGVVKMKNSGAGTIYAQAYIYRGSPYTSIQGTSAGNNQAGTISGAGPMTTTVFIFSGFYGGHTAQAAFECLVATDNTTTGTTDIGLQIYGDATNPVLLLAGSFIEVQEIT